MLQVDPRKHRMLLEVFDENRLVSYLVIFNRNVYNFDNTEKMATFSLELL